jgi:hypothetical protein
MPQEEGDEAIAWAAFSAMALYVLPLWTTPTWPPGKKTIEKGRATRAFDEGGLYKYIAINALNCH